MQTYDLCLINPPKPYLVNPHAQAPLGLLYLAATAETNGVWVRIANLAGAGMEACAWPIPRANIYGITGTYLDVEAVNAVARAIKARYGSDRHVMVGGPIALSANELDRDAIDLVVVGEGEGVVQSITSDDGWNYHDSYICGAPADVNALALPARHLWPGPFGGNVFIGGTNYFGGGSATLLTSRGCPYSCAFCAGPALRASVKVRFREPGSVVAEMESLVVDYGVRQYRLSDEHFTCRREHVEAVCAGIRASAILQHGAGLAWRASIAVNPHDLELFGTLRSAGCREVALGVESADPVVLNLIARKGDPFDAREALKNARTAGLRTKALLMVGLPGTLPITGRLNAEFIRADVADAIAITAFTPIPGCAIARDPEKYGCRLISERVKRSLCAYGPDGLNAIEPAIEIDGMPDAEFARQMRETIAAASGAGLLGKG